jgi:hypothetical protein
MQNINNLGAEIEQKTESSQPVLYLEHMSRETVDVARSHTSWMNFKTNSMEKYSNPFDFKNIRAITSTLEYNNAAYWPQTQRLKPLIVVTS